MAIWLELCTLTRWLLRRLQSPPPPGTAQRYQDVEQAAAQHRLLDYATQLRLRQGNRARHRIPINRGHWPQEGQQ
ncbi:hypothetical protein [Micromonospora sp. WMMD1082]|uniref:hypothetical protein n=1 Tax=Micromonospora sp. WMMD1082 TaxID=3016104 RepID=UPI002417807D|nr:hypothetical protein [Micromonospora sp. WMMD1082]MDG4793898.1 hypothetical protein [Micromonospora sp. WMMD1082]